MLERVSVAAHPDAPLSALSGGNQQKVLFARTMLAQPVALIADEPTRGVDIGAKRAIYDILVELAADGLAILLISSEMEEILGLSHRVVVMRAGRVTAELGEGEINERRSCTPRSRPDRKWRSEHDGRGAHRSAPARLTAATSARPRSSSRSSSSSSCWPSPARRS
jgi:ABC-type multidrug transport system ATPase subunit